LASFLSRFFSFLLRLLLIGVGLVFGAFLVLAGLFLTIVLLGWSVLRGKRPRIVRFRTDPQSPFSQMRRAAGEPRGEVVDIEAREVPDTAQQLKRGPG
jgi:hypothetical protein